MHSSFLILVTSNLNFFFLGRWLLLCNNQFLWNGCRVQLLVDTILTLPLRTTLQSQQTQKFQVHSPDLLPGRTLLMVIHGRVRREHSGIIRVWNRTPVLQEKFFSASILIIWQLPHYLVFLYNKAAKYRLNLKPIYNSTLNTSAC